MLTNELTSPRHPLFAIWRDYYTLTKPRVVQLLVFTAIVGMYLATPGLV
ncbi:MAG TPA: protoheme IX farnesyltransferase, partial [Planctomycetes bacterium]|nr:protoheme IX farnesyltransferase [Planctomycetota bacterium]